MSYKILIVDDSIAVRKSVRYVIEQNQEWQVCGEAENGVVALEKVREMDPDVVILDFGMPVMNGLEAAQCIHQISPQIGLVMFTMHAGEELRKYAQAVGIHQLVSKSEASLDALTNSIRAVLSQVAEN